MCGNPVVFQIHGIDKLEASKSSGSLEDSEGKPRTLTATEIYKKRAVWHEIFEAMDKSGDGKIDPTELQALLESRGLTKEEALVDEEVEEQAHSDERRTGLWEARRGDV